MSATLVRISTGFVNSTSDPVPGGFVDNNTGVPSYRGQLGKKFRFTKAQIAKRWDTALSTAPNSDVEIQYIKVASDSPVNPTRGLLMFWKSKADYEVTADDTQGYPFAGVLLGAKPEDAQHGFIGKVGNFAVKFKSSTTKTTPAIGDMAVTISGNSGLADVLADATAQTYGTENTNERVGRLETAITTQIATVSLNVID